MKILVTGFEPFNGGEVNPSEQILKALAEDGDENLITLTLPVEFNAAEKKLEEVILSNEPDVVLSFGQAAGRECITIERIAINIDDAKYPDNSGYQPVDTPVREEGPAAYFSNLPIKGMAEYLSANGIEARISNTAGTYVCNHVMYHGLYLTENRYPLMKAGFVHVPLMKEQAEGKENVPFMELIDMIRAARLLIIYLQEKA